MKRKLSILILTATIVGGGFYLLWTNYLWKKFSCSIAGSYECAQTWTLPVPQDTLTKIIREIKKEHPDLQPPLDTALIQEKERYWLHLLFHYKDTSQDIHSWTRDNENGTTTLAFVAIWTHADETTPPDKVKWDRKEINRDFDYYENKNEIQKFEDKIISLIRQKINDK